MKHTILIVPFLSYMADGYSTFFHMKTLPPCSSSSPSLPSWSCSRRQLLGIGPSIGAAMLASFAMAQPATAAGSGLMPPERLGDESIMSPKAHGTTETPVQKNLRFSVNNQLADQICSFNRHFAEPATSWEASTFEKEFLAEASEENPMTFYDSVTGKPLFQAPIGRSPQAFLAESRVHGKLMYFSPH